MKERETNRKKDLETYTVLRTRDDGERVKNKMADLERCKERDTEEERKKERKRDEMRMKKHNSCYLFLLRFVHC